MILVVGDVMLDTYFEGVVNRISPEAPVPVLLIANESHHLGGAANVAKNLKWLEAPVRLVSVVGDDDTGRVIQTELAANEIEHTFVVDKKRWSTRKTRYEAHGQQILRVDDECTNDIDSEDVAMLVWHIEALMDRLSVIVLSDYAKGVLTFDVCQKIITMGIPVVVDPKHKNFARYSGATMIKPNASELSAATGMPCETKEECLAAAIAVRDTFNISNVLVTRGHKGMLLLTPDGFYEEPGHPREVANVVGAGDTALAAIAMGMDKGWTPDKIIQFANMAAAIAVSKHGTTAVTRQEVYDAFK